MEFSKGIWRYNLVVKVGQALLAVVCSALLVSCVSESDEAVPVEQVLLVYLGGDNDLSYESNEKLYAITNGYFGSPNRRILLYQDTAEKETKLLEVKENGKMEVIETFLEENSADPAVLARVIRQSKQRYPEARFNLLLFSHASGWLPPGALANPRSSRSILNDKGDEMRLADFAAAIPDGMFDCIVFEACFMAGIEVAWELKEKTRYIAASSAEIVSPGFTTVYKTAIDELAAGNFIQFMEEAFRYFDKQTGYLNSATFSIIETKQLDALAEFVRTHRVSDREVDLSQIQFFDRTQGRHLFYDFGDYYAALLETALEKQQLQVLMDACIVWKASTSYFMSGYNGFPIIRHSGLTTYVAQARYPWLNAAYQELKWYQNSRE